MSYVTSELRRLSRRRVLSAGAAAGLAAGPLAGACAPGGGPGGDPSAGSKAPATIVYWCNVGQADWEKIQAAATEYGKKNPHHKMEASNFDTAGTPEADYGAKLITAFAGTEGQKDVENAGGRSIPGYKPVAETVFLQRKTLSINKQRWLDAAKEAKGQPLVRPWDEMNAIVGRYRNDLLDQKISSREAAQGIEREVNALLAQG